MKIAIVAVGRDGAADAFARSQQQGLAGAFAASHDVLLYRAAQPANRMKQRLAARVIRINFWAPGGERLAAIVGGLLVAIHLRLVEKPDHALVFNPWNAVFMSSRSARRGVLIAVDSLVNTRQKRSYPASMLARLLALRAKAHGYGLICRSEAAALAFRKRFGALPKVVATGLAATGLAAAKAPARNAKPDAIANDALLSDGFDLLVGSATNPVDDAQAIRAHSRGARDLPLVYLPALDVRRVDSEELDDAIGKHGRIRVIVNAVSSPITPWLTGAARRILASDQDLLGARLGAGALLAPAELLLLDSPANRELLSEVAWLWTGEASLANLLTDTPWARKSRAKVRVQGIKPLTDWKLVGQEILESFGG